MRSVRIHIGTQKEYAKNHLVLVITHDRSILKDADQIIEMWDGSISAIKGGDAV